MPGGREAAATAAREARLLAVSLGAAPLLARIDKARVVLIGEASHGTCEFYDLRARITQALVASDPNVRIVAVEGSTLRVAAH